MSARPERPQVGVPLEYVGFWLRVIASIVDSLWLLPVIGLLGAMLGHGHSAFLVSSPFDLASVIVDGGADNYLGELLAAALVLAFWIRRNATPGKLLLNARIVDAATGRPPTPRQLVIRYLGYYVSILPCLLGLIWVAWDPRKQGWHDKLAGTVVVRPLVDSPTPVRFPEEGRP